MLQQYLHKNGYVAGCDEAGRGCLAGPVVAAAVILPLDYKSKYLNDSKQLSKRKRDLLRQEIEKEALSWSVSFVGIEDIAKLNILWASVEGMHRALADLDPMPNHILIDGNRFKPYRNISYDMVIKGDGKYMSIAAASILAKTHRDEYMANLHEQFPDYNWIKNKGYPTKEHREAIKRVGATEYHRMSFKLLDNQLDLFKRVSSSN